jgi:hypothetical protein
VTAARQTVHGDDYPTGPIDFYNPADPVVAEMAKEDAHGNLHDARGRFTAKPVQYLHLVQVPDRPGIDRPWTEQELAEFGEFGPDYRGPQVTVWDWPTDPNETVLSEAGGAVRIGIGGQATTLAVVTEMLPDGSTRITYGGGRTVAVVLPGKGLDPGRVLHEGDPGWAERRHVAAVDPATAKQLATAVAGGSLRCTATLDSGPDKGTRCQLNTTWRKPGDLSVPLCHHHGGTK